MGQRKALMDREFQSLAVRGRKEKSNIDILRASRYGDRKIM